MALVVYLRGSNVGGHKVFRPSILVAELKEFELQSIGAAGTFVAHASVSATKLRSEILARLDFEPQIMVRPATEVARLVASEPFGRVPAGTKPFASVLAEKPKKVPKTPIDRPEGTSWQVRVTRVAGAYALSLQRGAIGKRLYPNEVVEKVLGVPATTRGWATMEKIVTALRG